MYNRYSCHKIIRSKRSLSSLVSKACIFFCSITWGLILRFLHLPGEYAMLADKFIMPLLLLPCNHCSYWTYGVEGMLACVYSLRSTHCRKFPYLKYRTNLELVLSRAVWWVLRPPCPPPRPDPRGKCKSGADFSLNLH